MNIKQKNIKIEPRIELNYNIYNSGVSRLACKGKGKCQVKSPTQLAQNFSFYSK